MAFRIIKGKSAVLLNPFFSFARNRDFQKKIECGEIEIG